jgi:hypothetical protein
VIWILELAKLKKAKESNEVRSITVTITRSTDTGGSFVEERNNGVESSYDADDSFDVDVRARTLRRSIPAVNSRPSDISKGAV